MIRARCSEFGNCRLADGATHEVVSVAEHDCPLRRETGLCGLEEVKGRGPMKVPDWAKPAALIAIALLLLSSVSYGAYTFVRTPACEVSEVRSLMALDPKVGELEDSGLACLEAGMASANADQLVVGIAALRVADAKGSAPASAALGRLFDPEARATLEEEAEMPSLLPATDARLAVQFYDRAAKQGDRASAEAAARLRAKHDLPAADGTQTGRNGAPLLVPGYSDIYQRVIAKPGALLSAAPGGAGGQPLRTFEILYVFGSRPGWIQVGRNLQRGAEGWIQEDRAQTWNAMLVMRYAPPGQRGPVLFFRDEIAVKALLGQPGAAAAVQELVQSATAGTPDPRLVAIEDKSVDWAASPYAMPILKAVAMTADDGRNVYLANVGSVNAGGGGSERPPGDAGSGAPCAGGSLASARHQVAFVIDTTASMGPYIHGVRRIADAWKSQIERRGLADKFRFGVVAYRNNMDDPAQAGLEYVTRAALPLAADSDMNAFASSMAQLSPASVSTHSFDEDAVAGLKDAVDFNWAAECGVRLMFLVTDAGALQSDDPKARNPGIGLSTIRARAAELGVRLFIVHIATPEARRAGNIETAASQYRQDLATAGGVGGYFAIADGSAASFGGYLTQVGAIIDAVANEQRGALQARPSVAAGRPASVREQVLTELFSVQQRFLGAAAGAQVATFTESWTSDRDLTNLDRTALEVSAFLTRRQLSLLAEQTDRLIRTARQAELETSRFFNLLRMVSAATTQDPTRFRDDVSRLDSMLPSFLKLLPYKSDVLSLSAEDWRAMGASKQDAFLRRLSEKLAFYRSLERDQSAWKSLGDSDQNNAVALVPLRELP